MNKEQIYFIKNRIIKTIEDLETKEKVGFIELELLKQQVNDLFNSPNTKE